MVKRVVNLALLIVGTSIFWFLQEEYTNPYLLKGFYTFLAFSIIYFIFKILGEMGLEKIVEARTRFFFRKVSNVAQFVVILVALISIWIEDTQTLLVSYGLIAAGVAIALQDFFKNIMGGLLLLINRPYNVGDRIEINSRFGDVIDIGVLYTTILEIKEWVEGDQPTGRLATIPNGWLLSQNINNYTRDYGFIWDEITIPITYDSDWQLAIKKITSVVKKETASAVKEAEKGLRVLKKKYFFTKRNLEPSIFLTMTDNWITFNIRYIAEAKERRIVHNELTQKILKEIQKTKKIKLASETLDIVGMPDLKFKNK